LPERNGWDWTGAEREFQTAIKLNPSYPTAHHGYAVLSMTTSRLEQAVAEAKRAQSVDPLSAPINSIVVTMLTWLGIGAKPSLRLCGTSS
jgi:hypothetical protein